MYYNLQSIANLLSMSVVTYKYHLTMDSGNKYAIVVHLENNQEIKVTCYIHGLFYFDTTNASTMETPKDNITDNKAIEKSKISVTGYSFVSTVATNKEYLPNEKLKERIMHNYYRKG